MKVPCWIRYVASATLSIRSAMTWYVGGRSAVAFSSHPVFDSIEKVPDVPESRIGPWSITTWPVRIAILVLKS